MQENLNRRVDDEAWSRALQVPWAVAAPNHGYFLRDGNEVVGAYLAYYSERTIRGQREKFCNLGAWCVLESYRAQGLRLLMSLLRQSNYHFTDLSPSGNVVALNRKLGFSDLDTTTTLIPNVPWPNLGKVRISKDSAVLSRTLTGEDRRIYQDHRKAAAARHILLLSDDEFCYIVFRKDSRKRLRAFASILYVSNKKLFERSTGPLGAYLLLHHGALATLVERRIVDVRPKGSMVLSRARPKMYKSTRLPADQIDYLYSELTCLEW